MRKLIYAINVTLDGCFDHTHGIPDDEVGDFSTQLLRDADVQVFGRKTYELMVPYWPDALHDPASTKTDIEFAEAFVSLKKVVFSRSLKSVEDKNTEILRGNLQDEILKLKEEKGKNILVGGVDIPSQLIKLGLIDEYLFIVAPVIGGQGRRLLEGTSPQMDLRLKFADSKIFKSGSVLLRYLKQ
jgi:dihydrofolate reductase